MFYKTSILNSDAMWFFNFFFTSLIRTFTINSFSKEVNFLSTIPHGTMLLKKEKSEFTFSAIPCIVTHRLV